MKILTSIVRIVTDKYCYYYYACTRLYTFLPVVSAVSTNASGGRALLNVVAAVILKRGDDVTNVVMIYSYSKS